MPVDVWADGSGDGTICVILNRDDEQPHVEHRTINTHNEAEYEALLLALALVDSYDRYNIHMDSQLVIRHMQGEYKVRSDTLRIYYDEAWDRINSWGLDIAFFWVRREINKAGKYLERMK